MFPPFGPGTDMNQMAAAWSCIGQMPPVGHPHPPPPNPFRKHVPGTRYKYRTPDGGVPMSGAPPNAEAAGNFFGGQFAGYGSSHPMTWYHKNGLIPPGYPGIGSMIAGSMTAFGAYHAGSVPNAWNPPAAPTGPPPAVPPPSSVGATVGSIPLPSDPRFKRAPSHENSPPMSGNRANGRLVKTVRFDGCDDIGMAVERSQLTVHVFKVNFVKPGATEGVTVHLPANLRNHKSNRFLAQMVGPSLPMREFILGLDIKKKIDEHPAWVEAGGIPEDQVGIVEVFEDEGTGTFKVGRKCMLSECYGRDNHRGRKITVGDFFGYPEGSEVGSEKPKYIVRIPC